MSQRIGRQTPSFSLVPEYHHTYGADAAFLMESYGTRPFEWQRHILDVWLAEDAYNLPAATSCGLSLSRQNGKNYVLEGRELYGAAVLGECILHTSHRVDSARKAFLRFLSFFENPQHPEMMELVKAIRRTNGQEAVELKNGGLVEFSSRISGSKRGFANISLIVFDEAQELDDDQLESIYMTLAASKSGRRQVIMTGTPPPPVSRGTVFAREREAALNHPGDRQAWHEWSVSEIGNVDDRERWYMTNPSLGLLLDEKFTEQERVTLSEDGFARERLGMWPAKVETVGNVIDPEAWEACGTSTPPADGVRVFAVKFSPDGAIGTVAVCLKPEQGAPHVEVVASRSMVSGLSWFADNLERASNDAAAIVVDGMSNAQPLIDELLRRGVSKRKIIKPTSGNVSSACSSFLNAVIEQGVTHFNQAALTKSATYSKRRPIGNAGGWGFGANDCDPTLVEACALAYWQTTQTKPKAKQKMKVGF